uniref:Coiled-coil domain containing 60 n=1 Tax=Ursus maritimus TaxID=29073 RepID=A0A452TWX0_URSMA
MHEAGHLGWHHSQSDWATCFSSCSRLARTVRKGSKNRRLKWTQRRFHHILLAKASSQPRYKEWGKIPPLDGEDAKSHCKYLMGALQRLDEMRNGKYHAWSMATALKVQASTALYVAIIVKDVVPTGSHCVPPSHLCLCREPLFRQLCALHWLLEALTIDHTYHTMNPVITCWNPKDPGGSKSTVKKINKDKLVQQRWEQFVNAPKTKKSKIPVVRVSHKPSRRGFTLGPSRTSGASSLQSSMVSTNPGSDEPTGVITQGTGSKKTEDNESPPTKPDEEPLHINLQKLLEMVREDARRTVMMENGMQRKAPRYTPFLRKAGSRQPETIPLCFSDRFISTNGESHSQVIQKKSKSRTNRDIIHSKTDVCSSMRAKFYSVAQEAGFVLQDKLEIFRKRQEERAHRMLQSFVITSNFKKDIAKMRHEATMVKGDADEIANHWYFQLLSKLPEDLKNFRPAQKILEKLQKFGENLDLRIRPHVLLKVLQDLRTWELCCPDIAVAIEFVREHIVHMPEEDYITWLQTRINLPI